MASPLFRRIDEFVVVVIVVVIKSSTRFVCTHECFSIRSALGDDHRPNYIARVLFVSIKTVESFRTHSNAHTKVTKTIYFIDKIYEQISNLN